MPSWKGCFLGKTRSGAEPRKSAARGEKYGVSDTTIGAVWILAPSGEYDFSGMGSKIFEVVFDIVDGIYDVAIASGIQIIIFLSGLQTISESMYEAAAIEGCTKWESLWKITFPMISSLFLVNWIYTIIDFCMRSDNAVMEKISDEMIVQINYGYSSALAWVYFLIVMVIIGISSLIISKGVYYYE